MKSQADHIVVYACASTDEIERLSGQLAHLGFGHTRVVRNPLQLTTVLEQDSIAALILLLTDEQSDGSGLARILQQGPTLPVLGLFTEQCPLFIQSIVKACTDIESFPCTHPELDFRLGRMICRDRCAEEFDDRFFREMKMVGSSPEFQQVLKKIFKIMTCDAPVFIDGETGTGKELVARAIHYLGLRKDQPFIAANCGAIPDQLVENELFGHDKGAFTDARNATEGIIAQAEGGTLFLDEIETLSPKAQVVLLRFLENSVYRPLGSRSARTANVRVITATNESVEELVERGEFRRDLFYRINIMKIVLPPLRARRGDTALLAEHFIRRFQLQYDQPDRVLHPDALAALQYHDWPGNVRELENTLHREFLMADGKYVFVDELVAAERERRGQSGDRRLDSLLCQPMRKAKAHVVEDFEQRYLSAALYRSNGNVSAAARMAGKERRSFARLLEKYKLDHNTFGAH